MSKRRMEGRRVEGWHGGVRGGELRSGMEG